MDDGPIAGFGLKPVVLSDQATFEAYFKSVVNPLSDYTFSQLFTWSNSLRILWKEIRGNLCVFANGCGDLTMLMPPIGGDHAQAALDESFEIMDAYNRAGGRSVTARDAARVEYASEELLWRFDMSRLVAEPMGMDYVYDSARMIDLAGSALASKRQLKNRFTRLYEHRVERFDPTRHLADCGALLGLWKDQQEKNDGGVICPTAQKRSKETIACGMTLAHAQALGLSGIVVYVRPRADAKELDVPQMPADGGGWSVGGFTFGEPLGADQSSITVEKTDLRVRGLAQFIFSEFCRLCWAGRPLVNAGDDWGIEALAWTKSSYRPVRLLQKYVLRPAVRAVASVPAVVVGDRCAPAVGADAGALQRHGGALGEVRVRQAVRGDLAAALRLEQTCFSAYCLSKRQLSYLQASPRAVFLVAEVDGKIVGEGISLVRKHKRAISGRIYSLAVASEARGQKVGRRLLEAMVGGMAQRGVRRVYLEVEQSNAAAVGLYERFGFCRIGELSGYYGEGKHGWHMMYEVK